MYTENAIPQRPWWEIADEAAREKDPERLIELAKELEREERCVEYESFHRTHPAGDRRRARGGHRGVPFFGFAQKIWPAHPLRVVPLVTVAATMIAKLWLTTNGG